MTNFIFDTVGIELLMWLIIGAVTVFGMAKERFKTNN